MKKSLLLKHDIIHRLLVLLFLWAPLLVIAQCPTLTDPNPVICDASNFTFADLNAFANDQGNGIVWYDSATGGSTFAATQLVEQSTYYAGDSTGTCGTRPAITVDFIVDPSGQNLDGIFCNNENPDIQLYINEVLQPNIPAGGSVEVYTDIDLTALANPTDAIPGGATNYYIVFVASGGTCKSQVEPGSTAVFDAPEDPTPPNPQQLCSDANPTLNELDPGTTSSFSWYENVDGLGVPIPPALALSTPLVDGNTYYVQVNDIFCISNAVPVTVLIDDPPEPGLSATLEYCEDNIPTSDFNLFDELTGTSIDVTGTWSGPLSTSNGHLGTVNISSLTTPGTYVFTYSLDAVGVCPDASSSVTIIIREILSSGIPSASNPVSFCEAELPSSFDLFSLLENEDPGGLWTQGTTSSDPAETSPIDLVGFAPGTYNFTYSQNVNPNPCPEESTTVQVIVLEDPNAGVAINQVFCENDISANSPFDLFDALDGSQDNNLGTWTDSGGTTVTNPIDITGFTISGSPYTYTYTIDNGTCIDTEDITITIEPSPESGTANPDAEFCVAEITTGETFDLFDLLEGEDQSGVWTDDTPSGALSGNLVTIDGLAPGTYDFTFDVNAIGTCDDVNITVSVVINDTPTPTGLATQSFCDSATVADLSATGTSILWYDDATGGTALASTDALVDGENYFASQTDAITGCESSVRLEVNVIVNQSPNSGTPGAPLTFCDNNTAVDLFTGLDGSQDATGTWFDTDGTGALTGNIFDASLVSAGSYQFTYTVIGIAPCIDSSTVITVTVEETVFAGTDTTLDICSDSGTLDILALLGGADTGGTWSPALTSGSNIFDPTSDSSGTYTYTISNSCSTDSSEIVISVTQAPDAGSDANADLCLVNGIVDLTTYLGGTPDTNGTWLPALTSGTNDFDPTIDTAGIYIYTVAAIAPCTTDSTAQLTVTISDSPEPVIVEPTLTFCLSENPTVSDLDSAVSGVSITWYEDDTSTTPLDPTDILLDGDDYYATQTTSSGCESTLRSQVFVIINDAPTPTLALEGNEFCISDSPILSEITINILEYDSNTNNIVWYDSDTDGSVLDGTTLLDHETIYYAALIDPSTGCESRFRLPVPADLTACGALVFPDGFSPNGDGVNDRYVVENLAFLHPSFIMEIYNRYGNLVYVGKTGTPLFDGTSNQSRLVTKGDLPVGVYFYVVNYNDGTKSKQGRLYLSR